MCHVQIIQRISSLQEFQFSSEACAGGEVTQESSSNPRNLWTTVFQSAKE